MADYGSGNRPSPRRRTSSQNAQRRSSSSRQRSVSRTSTRASSRASSRSTTRPGSAPSSRTRTASRTSARSNSATTLPIEPKWIAIIAGAIVVVVIIVALAFSCSGKSSEQASNEAGQAGQESSESAAMSYKNPGPYSVNFTTTGDLIFWREVADFIDENGGAAAMAGIADLLSGADVTISNLESPLSYDESEPVPDKDVYIIGRPEAIDGMVDSGIDIVSLANNHIMDYMGPALKDTLNALDEHGILHAGAGMNEADADKMVETTVNGVSIAFFSWTDIVPDNYVAYKDEPGVASARLNMDDALKRIREAKETHDIVIVAIHWGVEYQDYIDEYQQREPAHKFVDAGADVVLGNHPHVLEGIEFYDGSLIAYAHGNCVFRQAFEFGYTHESYVLNFDITQDGIENVVVTPLYLSDEYGIPGVATGEQAQATLSRLIEISEGMNSEFTIEGDVAHVKPAS